MCDNKILKIEAPFLGDLTNIWISEITKGNSNCLPNIEDSLGVHKLMFDWLSKSNFYKETFPIT